MPDVLLFHALTLLMVSGRMEWDAALHVAWNGGKCSFFTRRALVAPQSAGLGPPPHKPSPTEGSLTAFCKVTAHYTITGAFLETGSESTRTAEGLIKKGNPLKVFHVAPRSVQPVWQNQMSHSWVGLFKFSWKRHYLNIFQLPFISPALYFSP